MNRKTLMISMIAIVAIALFGMAGCKSGGMAVTSRGQLLKINIDGANDLPEGGTEDLTVNVSNRGINNVQNVLVDVEVPAELVIESQTADRGIDVLHDEGSLGYHFSMNNIQPGETSKIRFAVRTRFGTLDHTGDIKVTAWQKDLPGDKLIETRSIKLRK